MSCQPLRPTEEAFEANHAIRTSAGGSATSKSFLRVMRGPCSIADYKGKCCQHKDSITDSAGGPT